MPSHTTHLPTHHLGGTAHLILDSSAGGRGGLIGAWIDRLEVPTIDQVWLDPETTDRISINDIRGFVSELSRAPVGSLRVGVIVGAWRLTPEAGNALLKFLEEPSRQTLVILEARSEDQLLPTIVSRCQRWRLARSEVSVRPDTAISVTSLREQALKDSFAFAKEWADHDDFIAMYDTIIDQLRTLVKEGKVGLSVLADVFGQRALAETTVSRRLLAEVVLLMIRRG